MSELALQHERWVKVRARIEGVIPPQPRPAKARPLSPFHRNRRLGFGSKMRRKWETIPFMFPVITTQAFAHYPFELGSARAIKPHWRVILEEVAEHHGFNVKELLSRRRMVALVAARHEAMWRMRQETSMSLPEIAMRLGNRDHTTVLWGLRKHLARLEGKGLIREELQATASVSPTINTINGKSAGEAHRG